MKSSKQENTGSNKYIIKTKNMDIEAIFTCLPSTASTTISATLPSDLQLETIFICGSTSITDLLASVLQILFHIHILTHYALCGINSKTYLPPHSLPYWFCSIHYASIKRLSLFPPKTNLILRFLLSWRVFEETPLANTTTRSMAYEIMCVEENEAEWVRCRVRVYQKKEPVSQK